MSRATQRPPVSIRFPSEESEAEARRRAARNGVTLNAYVVHRTSGRGGLTTRMIGLGFILEQLRELDDYLATGETAAARERIARLRESLVDPRRFSGGGR